jgi:arsenite methyltransferase
METEMKDSTQIKKAVQTHYAEIAQNRQAGCCTTSNNDCCSNTSDLIALSTILPREDTTIGEADLGLGCGLPTLYADIQPGDIVLDLGSGAGVDVFRAARLTGPEGRVIGVDMTPEMIARANENAMRGNITNVDFRLGDIEELPVEDATVDVVLSNCVINLAPDKNRVFKEIFRVIRHGGSFSVSDIVTYGDVPDDIRNNLALWAGCISGAIDRDEYLGIIQQQGFTGVTIKKQVDYQQEPETAYGIASITVSALKP